MDTRSFGPYHLLERLGAGGMGTVYRARRSGDAVDVAIKILAPDMTPDARARFLREAELGQRVASARVMRIESAVEATWEGRPHQALVMEYVPGESLRQALDRHGSLDEVLVRHLAAEITLGLRDLHAHGVVHRDLKPDNVLVTPDERVKIVDLGIARYEDAETQISRTGQFVGSVQYAAPEQFSAAAEADGRTDLFALGGLLYQLLTGVHPFRDTSLGAVLRRILSEAPAPLSRYRADIDPFLETLILQCLEKEPARRPPSAAFVVEALAAGRSGRWWAEHGRSASQRAGPWRPTVVRDVAFVARKTERRAVEAWLATGTAGVLVLTGAAGSGKSRLLDQVLLDDRTAERDRVVLGTAFPRGFAGAAGDARLELERAVGIEADNTDPPAGDARARDEHRLARLAKAVIDAAHGAPLLVVFEDIDAAWPHARPTLAGLLPTLQAAGVQVLLTHRVGAPACEDVVAWVDALAERFPVTRQQLEPLTEPEATELGAARLDNPVLAGDLVPTCFEQVGGHPGPLLDMLDQLHVLGILHEDEHGHVRRADRSLVLPARSNQASSRRDLADYLDTYGSPVRDAIELGACLGSPFDPTDVARLLGIEILPLLRALAPVVRAGHALRAHGRLFRFPSRSIEAAIREQMPEPLVFAYHQAILRDLRSNGTGAPQGPLALRAVRHALCADDAPAILDLADAALRHLETQGTYGVAAELVRDLAACRVIPPSERLRWLLHVCTDDGYAAASFDRETRLADAERLASESNDATAWLDARLARIHARLDLAGADQAAALFDEAFEGARRSAPTEQRLRAELADALRHKAGRRTTESIAQLEQLITGARAAELPEVEAKAHHALGLLLRRSARSADGKPHLEATLEIARRLGRARLELDALNSLAYYPFAEGDSETARLLQLEALAIAVRLSDRPAQVRIHINLAQVMLGASELGAALTHARPAVDLARTLWIRSPLIAALRLQVRLGALVGDFVGGAAALAELDDVHLGSMPPDHAGFTALFAGHLATARDDLEAALACYQESRHHFATGHHDAGRMFALARAARCLWRLGRPTEATPLIETALELARQGTAPRDVVELELLGACITGNPDAEIDVLRTTWSARFPTWNLVEQADDFHHAFGREQDARAAVRYLHESAATLADDERAAYLHGVPQNRRILERLDTLGTQPSSGHDAS